MNNQRLRKMAKVFASVVFLVALIVNVKVTLDDPFLMLTEGVLAKSSSFSFCATVSLLEAINEKSRNEKRGDIVTMWQYNPIEECTRTWRKNSIVISCRIVKVEKVQRSYCDCVGATKQDYCLYR